MSNHLVTESMHDKPGYASSLSILEVLLEISSQSALTKDLQSTLLPALLQTSGKLCWTVQADFWSELQRSDCLIDIESIARRCTSSTLSGIFHYLEPAADIYYSLKCFEELWNKVHGYIRITIDKKSSDISIEIYDPNNLGTPIELHFWSNIIIHYINKSWTIYNLPENGITLTSPQSKATNSYTISINKKSLPNFTSPLTDSNIILTAIAESVHEASLEDDWLAKISSAILTDIANDPGLPSIAKKLHTTPRTLQRKLEITNMTFADFHEKHRKLLAYIRLTYGYYSIAQISDQLGYTEVSNFIRAFNRWYGCSPGSFYDGSLKFNK